MNNKIFKQDAKTIVDMLFDAKLFKDNLTRDDFNKVEEILLFTLESRFNSHVKMTELMERIKETKKEKSN